MTKMLLTVALLCASLLLQGTGSAHAASDASQPDQVIQWNRTLLQILQTPGAQPATIHPTRSMAIVHLAIYDAVNAIRGGHAPYLVLHAPRNASPEAAAAAAAHTALLSLFPNQQSVIDAKFQDSLSQIGSGAHVRQGIRVGEEAANAILAARADDGSDSTPAVFVPQSGPGEYQLTPPNFKQPVFTNWPDVRPFALETGDQFRPPPPPAVTSPRYTTDFDEIKSLGEINSTTRSADQTDIGRFWGAAPVQNVWNQIDRKSTRLNSSHRCISYAVFCLKKKTKLLKSERQLVNPVDKLFVTAFQREAKTDQPCALRNVDESAGADAAAAQPAYVDVALTL